MFKQYSVLLLCVSVIQGQYELGDVCDFDEKRRLSGVCEIIHKCEYAKKRVYEDEVHVPGCGWIGSTRVVCCPEGERGHETGKLREYFRDAAEGILRNDDTICRYNGELPMMCCPKIPEYPLPKEPNECPRLPNIPTPRFKDPTHAIAWEKCIENQRFVRICEQDEQDLSKYRRTYTCNVLDDVTRITGDTPAGLKEFPHMAVLGCQNNREIDDAGDAAADIVWIGGGSLISDRFILTAAHVLNEATYGPLRYALLGVLDKKDLRNGELYFVIRRIPHKNYVSSNKHDDIALLELDRQVKFSEFIRPICLPVPELRHDSTQRIIAGWGETGSHSRTSKALLKAYIDEVKAAECIKSLQAENFTWDETIMICARGLLLGGRYNSQYADSCSGDSGGPLMSRVLNENLECNYVINGVVSWGPNCGTGSPGAYTRVAPYISWIVNTTWPKKPTVVLDGFAHY